MISTHILDLTSGRPAAGVVVELAKKNDEKSGADWHRLAETITNADGRIQFDIESAAGVYCLTFKIEDYLRKQNLEPFFTVAPVTFQISDTKRKYHIPLLLSLYGYSTYRGS
jgi:5-hydroxyisourate hydrolase